MNLVALFNIFSIFLIIYHHAGYPILLRVIRNRHINAKNKSIENYENNTSVDCSSLENHTKHELPFISILIPAFNEEKYIAEKIRNLAILDYPSEKYEVVIATDGCTDNTVAEALKAHSEFICQHLTLSIIEFPKNRGKVALLNALVPKMKYDIVALSDASALISIDALRWLADGFSNSNIGAINGNYRLLSGANGGEAHYWKYQQGIKQGEQVLGSILGAHGAFYALRKNLFKKLQEDIINDDFIIPMKIIEQGFQVIYDEKINAVELEGNQLDQDWRRRVRIGFGNAQQIAVLKNLFSPRYKGIAFSFFSGKGLRVFMPFFMLFSFVSSWVLYETPLFFLIAVAQTFGYMCVGACHIFPKVSKIPLLSSVHYLVLGHFASLIGSVKYFTKQRNLRWS